MAVYQHWDQLKTCMVGKSYPPEFYSWIKNPKARNAMERIAIETEEDLQLLCNLIKSFNVKVIRPSISNNFEQYFNNSSQSYAKPPLTPRDYIGTYGLSTFIDYPKSPYIIKFYNNIKDNSWPNIKTIEEFNKLPNHILNELFKFYNLKHELKISNKDISLNESLKPFKHALIDALLNNNITPIHSNIEINNASVCRVGKDLYYPRSISNDDTINNIRKVLKNNYRITYYNGIGHADSCFCPVVPGLIISLHDFQEYEKTFPGWEVVELPNQSWEKVSPFLKLKMKNKGKWWVPGEEGNDALTELIEDWLDNWVGHVEETVFDVNMLIINEQNVIVNNYNKKVFDALERYGVTPHICNFRHRYFWDGGIHCITADLDREGEMHDYFPERGEY